MKLLSQRDVGMSVWGFGLAVFRVDEVLDVVDD